MEQDYLQSDGHDVDKEQDNHHCDDHDVDNEHEEVEEEELLLNFKGFRKSLRSTTLSTMLIIHLGWSKYDHKEDQNENNIRFA